MKRHLFSAVYGVLLLAFTAYVLLYIYVLPQDGVEVVIPTDEESESVSIDGKEDIIVTEDTYADGNIKTAFARDRYGRNIKEKTSVIAKSKSAILAVNGDYYSAREGCVLRNGTIYRGFEGYSDNEALVIYDNGAVDIVSEAAGDAEALKAAGAVQILSFGPALVKNGEVSVTTGDEVDKAMANNPRTAFVYYGKNHYAFVVGDGRTSESKGLSLYDLAVFLKGLGGVHAYNLDGGGSSTMYFNGEVVNNPTTNGKKISEREVSDIVYIGYNY